MKKLSLFFFIVLSLFLLTSCLSSGIDINVNKDGSGEIVQTFKVLKEYMAFLNADGNIADPNMINEVELKKMASLMGEGVVLDRVEPMAASSNFAGYMAYFTFPDISKVQTSRSPITSPGEVEIDKSDWISFDFKKGRTPVLTIITPPESTSDYDSEDEDMELETNQQADPSMMEQMKQVYKSIEFWIRIKVDGDIKKTNASYANGSVVTIMDMKFDKIVENDELFTKMTAGSEDDMEEYKDELEKLGVKIDFQEKIEISFR